jgi:hypothetical protein
MLKLTVARSVIKYYFKYRVTSVLFNKEIVAISCQNTKKTIKHIIINIP